MKDFNKDKKKKKGARLKVETFPCKGIECSGPRMWAWVRIPHLTLIFVLLFLLCFFFLTLICRNLSSRVDIIFLVEYMERSQRYNECKWMTNITELFTTSNAM
jgi:hypothetical protein